jgi:hypothetical protein
MVKFLDDGLKGHGDKSIILMLDLKILAMESKILMLDSMVIMTELKILAMDLLQH